MSRWKKISKLLSEGVVDENLPTYPSDASDELPTSFSKIGKRKVKKELDGTEISKTPPNYASTVEYMDHNKVLPIHESESDFEKFLKLTNEDDMPGDELYDAQKGKKLVSEDDDEKKLDEEEDEDDEKKLDEEEDEDDEKKLDEEEDEDDEKKLDE
ncbi:hypothetical protein RZS08_10880, partial [Arthrospira platensis SPKY1]|nr:hypothetical protein [Arthrospira platensis SPKY1]